ncbi:bifunctional oligoribonuclease/PAP phosphatase NrnA [Aciduricibacillus chroicocephali]|uniref:Bifunctional oligoribonuclease/PAP phosphatase NrnA n=1 Tax=Aciduricibacillus chroicocephali TaxID=3054939 RepID=A0ABY9KSI2_9BACI|nr:bifunctional oligoribonuclease/PAP phosphatase NrnA [Bacillaceae bacterium 44XB]
MIREIAEEIKKYETIILHRHIRPDPDAYGSQAGLGEILRASFPDKKIYLTGEEDPDLEFLIRMDTVTDDMYEGALVIVCDTANTERISDQRYNKGAKLIKIDHHPNNDPYGDLLWVDTNASSCSEMIYEFYLENKDNGFKMTDSAARLIYGGIVGDTGRFLFPSATDKTFRVAAELVQYNFDRTALYNGLYDVKDAIAKLKGYVLSNYELLPSGACAIKLTREIIEKYDVTVAETSALVGILGDIRGIKAWVYFIEEEKEIRVRLRSKGPVINKLANKYNGGGHPLASGAAVYSWNEADALISDLDALCAEYK